MNEERYAWHCETEDERMRLLAFRARWAANHYGEPMAMVVREGELKNTFGSAVGPEDELVVVVEPEVDRG